MKRVQFSSSIVEIPPPSNNNMMNTKPENAPLDSNPGTESGTGVFSLALR